MKRDTQFILDKVFNGTTGNGGITTDLDGNEPDYGYMVAVKGCERVVSLDLFNKDNILSYINLFRHKIGAGSYLGTWLNEGKVYLDVSVNFATLNEAIRFGRENKQLAIYSLNSGKEITL